jgi:hypothetical protein
MEETVRYSIPEVLKDKLLALSAGSSVEETEIAIYSAPNVRYQDALRHQRGTQSNLFPAIKKNLWRYRIGDFRIVNLPDGSQRTIMLMAFAARGSVYE